MNTLLLFHNERTTQHIGPTKQTKLPSLPEHELPIDRAIRNAGGTPIAKREVVRHKRMMLRTEKMRRRIPLWWSGRFQNGLLPAFGIGLLFTALCLVYGLLVGLSVSFQLGTTAALRVYILPPGLAFTCIVLILAGLDRISWVTPYWVSVTLEQYEEMHCYRPIPIPTDVLTLIDEIRARLLEARFRVEYLEFACDPILSVSHRGVRRYLAIWD